MFVSPRKWIRSGLGWIQEILYLTSRLSRKVAPTLHCVLEKILYREAWCFAGKWDRVRVVAVIYAVVHAMKMTEYRVLC